MKKLLQPCGQSQTSKKTYTMCTFCDIAGA